MHRVVGSVALATELSLDLIMSSPVQEVMATQRIVAVGPTHQQPPLRDDGEHPDVVLAVLGPLPLEVTRGEVLRAAGPVDPLKSENWIRFSAREICTKLLLKTSKELMTDGAGNFPWLILIYLRDKNRFIWKNIFVSAPESGTG